MIQRVGLLEHLCDSKRFSDCLTAGFRLSHCLDIDLMNFYRVLVSLQSYESEAANLVTSLAWEADHTMEGDL